MLPKLVSILFLLSLLIAVFCCTKGQEENSDIQGVDKRSSLVARECGRRLVWARYKLVCLKAKRSQRKLQARVSSTLLALVFREQHCVVASIFISQSRIVGKIYQFTCSCQPPRISQVKFVLTHSFSPISGKGGKLSAIF